MKWNQLILLCASVPVCRGAVPCTVKADSAPVYLRMTQSSRIVKRLAKGVAVSNDFSINTAEGGWCAVREANAPELIGYVRCGALSCQVPEDFTASRAAVRPAATPAERDRLIDEVLTLSGDKENAQFLDALVQAQARALPPAALKAFQQVFQREELYRTLRDQLRTGFDISRMLQMRDICSSPLMQTWSTQKTADHSSEGLEARARFVQNFERNPPSPERLAMIQKLNEVTGATQVAGTMIEMIARRVTGQEPGASQELQSMQPQIARTVAAQLAFSVRGLDDGQLRELVAFHEAEPFRWYSSVTGQAAVNWARLVGERLGQLRVQQTEK